MKPKTAKKGEHDETLAIGTKTYACRFRQDARAGYHATCPAPPSVFAYGPDLPSARTALRQEIEALIWERELRYEEDASGMLQSAL
jgi:hypothetical protein